MNKIIVANWKMNPSSLKEAEEMVEKLGEIDSEKVDLIIAPPFVYMHLFEGIRIAAQNCFYEKKGAFTGEISTGMLKSLGCDYVILGHSERRTVLKESNEEISKKLKAVISEGMTPILAVGETLEERNEGIVSRVIKNQLEEGLKGISLGKKHVIIAYEPVWAIGTGKSADPDTAFQMKLLIKKTISNLSSKKTAENTPILYGGSVDEDNFMKYIADAMFDGLLVGGASLNIKKFKKIIDKING